MPRISISTYVPGDQATVFSHVTGFPAAGAPDLRRLEDKYGRLEEDDGRTYIFRDSAGTATRWRYTFNPPHTREAVDLDTNWSDRTDMFVAAGDGTTWTITWEPKSRGAPFLLRWLFFRWKDREMLRSQMMQPVIDHFNKREFY